MEGKQMIQSIKIGCMKIDFLIMEDGLHKIVLENENTGSRNTVKVESEVGVELLNTDGQKLTTDDFHFKGCSLNDEGFQLFYENDLLSAQISYVTDNSLSGLRKRIILTNLSERLLTISRIYTLIWSEVGQIEAGGCGLPIYIHDFLFTGVDHPYGTTEYDGKQVRLYHNPGEVLYPGGRLNAFTTLIGISPEQTARKDFVDYIDRTSKSRGQNYVYGDWGLHDELAEKGYTVELTEDMTLSNIKLLKEFKELAGIHFDYYLIDHGWYDPEGEYIRLKKPNWRSDDFAQITEKLEEIGIKPGLWFSVNNYFANDDGIRCGLIGEDLVQNRSDRVAEHGSYCISSEPYHSILQNAMLYWAGKGIKFFKLDFMSLDCQHPVHQNMPKECRTEKDCNIFLNILAEVRKVDKNIIFVGFNGFNTSPFWLKHVDTLFVGDPQPCDFPSPRLRTSINLFTDRKLHWFAQRDIPRRLLDDCGTMVGNTTTIFYTGCLDWKSMALLSSGRGGSFLWYYGDYNLLSHEDRDFFGLIQKTLECYSEVQGRTENIGIPDGKGVYGYAHTNLGNGYMVLYNPNLNTAISEVTVLDQTIVYDLAPMEAQWIDFASGEVILTSGKLPGYHHAHNLSKVKYSQPDSSSFEFMVTAEKGCEGDQIAFYLRFVLKGEAFKDNYLCKKLSPSIIVDGLPCNVKSIPEGFCWNGLSWVCLLAQGVCIQGKGEQITLQLQSKDLPEEIEIEVEGYIIESF